MNRNRLKAYAPKARRDFIRAVTEQAAKVGIAKDHIEQVEVKGDVAIIGGRAFPRKIAEQRRKLVSRINLYGFDQVMEGVAYTWFNRFAAIRYMELHEYLDHGYRVLSHPEGRDSPEILEQADHVNLPGLVRVEVVDLKLDGTRDGELYRLLLVAQCNALHAAMPFLFEKIDDETELLLPDNLLHSDSLIREMIGAINEEDWEEIEIIGWLYQFYISEKKDQVIGKVVRSEDIPAATQLFTPNWIVKYLVQNSLGHLWMVTYPSSSLKDGLDYYIEPAEQTGEVQAQLAEITPEELNPEDITFLDPACGSGHILVEAYDLFKAIYEERGYTRRDIPRLILEKNLHGLEIDDRAAQLSGFALMMKARSDDRGILSNPVDLNVVSIQSSEGLDAVDIAKHLLSSGRYELVEPDDLLPGTLAQPTLAVDLSNEVKTETIESLVNLFEDAKIFGSLIKVPDNIERVLPALRNLLDQPSTGDLLQRQMREHAVDAVKALVKQANMLSQSYDCVVANPPYLGGKGMNGELKRFAKVNYPNGKSDLFAIFMEHAFTLLKPNGFNAQVNMQSWMFLSSYESLRDWLLGTKTIMSMAHLGARAFGSIAGEVVQTTAWIISESRIKRYQAPFFRLVEGGEDEKKEALKRRSNRFDSILQDDFKQIPGSPIAYWVSESLIAAFERGSPLGSVGKIVVGLQTGENAKFVRYWSEVSMRNIGLNIKTRDEAVESGCKWFPYNKGGDFCRWYGNQEYVVNWFDDGKEIRNFVDSGGKLRSRPQNLEQYFQKSISWSKVSSSLPAFRFFPNGFVFDVAGTSIFPDQENLFKEILGFCNSKVATEFLKALSPTLNFEVGHITSLPFLFDVGLGSVEETVNNLIVIAESDFESFATSWKFESFPLLRGTLRKPNVEASFDAWKSQCRTNIQAMKELEEENNQLFIDAYGLHEDLTPEVPLEEITLACNPDYRYGADKTQNELDALSLTDSMKELISYAIACMMGRYSLDERGLIYADGGNIGFDTTKYSTFPADDDGIIPVTDNDWFDGDAVRRFSEFLVAAWSHETLTENLRFIADSLSPKRGETPINTIRRYLSTGFYKDHLKTYKKRPIYWLFSSGKQKAFECLVYLHRYNESTLSRMRMKYVIPLQGKFAARLEQLDGDIAAATSTPSRRKLEKEKDALLKKQAELVEFDDKLRHYADQRIELDLDDGVRVNYGKFGDLLADAKAITGKK